MEEKKIIYQIVLDVWNLAKEYGFNTLSEKEWNEMTQQGAVLREKYRQQGESFMGLFTGMFFAMQEYYGTKSGEKPNGNC